MFLKSARLLKISILLVFIFSCFRAFVSWGPVDTAATGPSCPLTFCLHCASVSVLLTFRGHVLALNKKFNLDPFYDYKTG